MVSTCPTGPSIICGMPPLDRPADAVASSATPDTRSIRSGYWRAKDITVMPPIECPTRKMRPAGMRSRMMLARSAAVWPMVQASASG